MNLEDLKIEYDKLQIKYSDLISTAKRYMKKINLNKEQTIKYLNPINNMCGSYGVLNIFDENTLIKIFHKPISEIYNYQNYEKLDSRICELLKEEEIFKHYNIDTLSKLLTLYTKLQNTHSQILEGIVFYNDYPIGTLLKYYKGYINLGEIFISLTETQKQNCIEKICFLYYELINNGIYPRDIKWNNILINPHNFDIKIIDLDDNETLVQDRANAKINSIASLDKFIKQLKDRCNIEKRK